MANLQLQLSILGSLVEVEVEVDVKLQPTVRRPIRRGVRHPSGTRDQFFFLLEILLRQVRVCYFVAPSLTRRQVRNLLLLVLASAVTRDTRPYFIVPILETPPTWRNRSPYLYPPGTGWPRYTPGHWVPFPSPLTTSRATVEVFYPASTRDSLCFYQGTTLAKLDGRVLWRGPHWKRRIQHNLHCCMQFLSDGFGTVACLQSHCLSMAVSLVLYSRRYTSCNNIILQTTPFE
jgi:hypothetical protein